MLEFLTSSAAVFCFLLIVSWRRRAEHDGRALWLFHEARNHPRICVASTVASFALFPLQLPDIWGVYLSSPLLQALATAASLIVFALLITGLVLWLCDVLTSAGKAPCRWKMSATRVFVLSWTAGFLFLAAFGLAFGYTESFDFASTQCRQMATGQYGLIHPVLHTLLCQGLLLLWNDHAVIALFQIVCFSLACATYAAFCRRAEVPKLWAWASTAAILVSLANFALSLNKDVPYVSGLILLTTGLAQVALSSGRRGLLATGSGLVLVATMRYDGLLVALTAGGGVLLSASILWERATRRATIVACATAALLILLGTVAVPRLVHAHNQDTGAKYAKPAFVLACLRAENHEMSAELKHGIDTYILPWDFNSRQHPLLSGYRNGEVYLWPFLFKDPDDRPHSLVMSLNDDNRARYLALFASAAKQYPWQTAKILLLNAQMAWNCRPMFVLSCAFWLLLCAAAGCQLVRATRRPALLLPLLPGFTAMAAMAVAATSWELRYCYGPLATAPVILGYAYSAMRLKRLARPEDALTPKGEGRAPQAGSISSVNPS